jgi:hypothetical protein
VCVVGVQRERKAWVSLTHAGASQKSTELVLQRRQRYFAASDPVERRAILEEIIDVIVNQPGRFVKQDKQSGEWQSISRTDAATKTARAMQYQARHIKASAAAAATDIAVRAAAAAALRQEHKTMMVVDAPSAADTFTHDHPMLSPLAEYSPVPTAPPPDPVLPSPGWTQPPAPPPAQHLQGGAGAPLWDSGTPLEHYYAYRAWLTWNHPSQDELVCRRRRVSDMGENDWSLPPPPRWTMRHHPELHVPLLRHRHQGQLLTTLHDDAFASMYPTADATTRLAQIPPRLMPRPSSSKEHHHGRVLNLPLHDLSGMVDDSVRSDNGDNDWCATSLGSFNSEDELEQLDRDMKW